MKRILSDTVLKAASKFPILSKCLVWSWAKTSIIFSRPPRYLLLQMANALNYRIHTVAHLKNGMKIKVVWNDLLGLEILKTGIHDARNVELLSNLLASGMVFFDIGAHVGQYTLIASRIVGDHGEVHSFEPDPETFQCLTDNVAINGLTNVHPNQVALSDQDGRKTLYLSWPEFMGGNSLGTPSRESWPGQIVQVTCKTLDGYVRSCALDRIDILKMDVEGAEVDALEGAKELLGSERKPICLLEFNDPALKNLGHSSAQLAHLLEAYGYDLFRVTDVGLLRWGPEPAPGEVYDCLALPRTSAATVLDRLGVFQGEPVG